MRLALGLAVAIVGIAAIALYIGMVVWAGAEYHSRGFSFGLKHIVGLVSLGVFIVSQYLTRPNGPLNIHGSVWRRQ